MARDPIHLILLERKRQDEKWGEQNHDDLYWLGILTEEVGELARAIIDGMTSIAGNLITHPSLSIARKELVEVAAVALSWLECIERREKRAAHR